MEYLLLLLALLWVGSLLYTGYRKGRGSDITPVHKWPASGAYATEVVGESFHADTLVELAKKYKGRGKPVPLAVLVPDDRNRHDDKAVRVEIDGYTVGHLSRADARCFRKRLSVLGFGTSPTGCNAQIRGYDGIFGVWLDIDPPCGDD